MTEVPERREGRRLDDVLAAPDAHPATLLAELQAAYENLSTAEEEIRVQRGTIERFAASRDEASRQHERNMLLVATPVFTTDRDGMIRAVNGAAAAVLQSRVDNLRGTSVFALITAGSRRVLRRLLERHDPRSEPCLCHLDLLPGPAAGRTPGPVGPVRVGVTVLPVPNVEDEMTWVLLPSGDAGRAAGGGDLAEALTQLAALPPVTGDLRGYLRGAAAVVADHVGANAHASIVVGAVEAPEVLGASSTHAQRLDGAQMTAAQGPTHAAYAAVAVVESHALAADARWPALVRQVRPADGGAVAAPLTDSNGPIGAVTVYQRTRSWDQGLARRLPLLAAAIAAGVQVTAAKAEAAELVANLRIALETRATIEQAKGIIMATKGCDADAAFAQLAEHSSLQHRKVRDVARDVIDGIRR